MMRSQRLGFGGQPRPSKLACKETSPGKGQACSCGSKPGMGAPRLSA